MRAPSLGSRSPTRTLAIGVVLVLGVLGLRLAYLTSQSLWYDEGFSLAYSSGPNLSDTLAQIGSATGSERYQPLYYLMLFAWRTVLGSGAEALRALSVVLGSAAIIVMAATAWRFYGMGHALWSLLLGATAASAIYYSQEARPYSLMLLVASVQLWAFLEVVREARHGAARSARWVFWLAAFVGFGASLLLGLFTASLFLADLYSRRSVRRTVALWYPVAILAIPAAAYYVVGFLSQKPDEISSLGGSVLRNAVFVPYGLIVGTTYGPPIEDLHGPDQVQIILGYWPTLTVFAIVALALSGLLLRALLSKPRSDDSARIDQILIVVAAAGFALSLGFAIVTRLNWLPRHSLYLLLPILLLLPAVVSRPAIAAGASPRWRILGAIVLAAFVALNLVSVAHYYFDPHYARDDYRAAATYLARVDSGGAKSVLLWGQLDLLRYYNDTQTLDGRGLDKSDIREEIRRISGGNDIVAVAINRDFYWDPAGVSYLDQAMAPTYLLTAAVTYPFFAIHTFQLRATASP
jgi:hypothetical protein